MDKKYIINKDMIKKCKKYIEKNDEDCQNSIIFHSDNINYKGADKEWHKARLGIKVEEKQTLEYIKFVLEFVEECYEEVEQKRIKEKNIIRQLTIYD